MRIQRLRITFGRGAELRYITHLDLMRFWERAFRRAAVEIAYSEGFSPHAQISLAAPLPVGVTARAERMDVYLARRMSPRTLIQAVSAQLPPGLAISEIEEIAIGLPSIQSQLRAAEYEATLPDGADHSGIEAAIQSLLARETVPWQHMRERELRVYDLRPLVFALALDSSTDPARVVMRLRADNSASGRPDQVLAALSLLDLPIERTCLILADDEQSPSAALATPLPQGIEANVE